MAKCLSDIKTDLTREIATKLAREGATIEGEMGYFPNPKKADKAIGKINAEYRELVVQQGEQGNFSILPSDRLAEYYLDEYNRMKEIERAKGLDEMNFRPEGFYMGDQALEDQEKKDLFFQTTAGKQFTDAMRESLLTFLKGLNISVEFNADELLNSTSFRNNPLAGFDMLQKFMAFASGQEKLLPRQVAAAAYTFLGKKSTLSKALWNNIKLWEDYDRWYEHYDNFETTPVDEGIGYDEDDYVEDKHFNPFAHRMAIVKFLEQSMMKVQGGATPLDKKLNEDIDKEYFEKRGYLNVYEGNALEKAFKRFYNWLRRLFSEPVFETYDRSKLADLGLDIADDILKSNYEKFIRSVVEKDGKLYSASGKELEVKDYNKTLQSDPTAKSIIDKLVSNPFINFKLSGSLTLRLFGRLFRPMDENLHDIDGVIELDTFMRDPLAPAFTRWIQTRGLQLKAQGNMRQFFAEVTPKLEELNWFINVRKEFPNFQLENIFIGKDHKNGESVTIQGSVEKNGTEYKLDFFLRTAEGFYPEIFNNYWKDWKQIFEAKLNMGRSKDISDLVYFDPFLKDKYKFTNKGFRYMVFEEEGSSLVQLDGIPASTASEQVLAKVKEVAAKMGISIESLDDYAKRTKLDVRGVNGVADLLRGVIALAEGREAVALTEELVHIATAAIEQIDPAMMTEMISKITRFSIYSRVFNEYSKRKEYQLPNGKPDIRKIKKEAVDKLITEVIVNGGSDTQNNPELRQEANKSLVQSWWEAIKDWFRGRYRKTNISIYEEAAARILRGDAGTVADVRSNGVFLQLSNEQERLGNALAETRRMVTKREGNIEGDHLLIDSEEANNFYVLATSARKIKNRVTDRVKRWYRRRFGDKTFTQEELAMNELKRIYGVRGHKDLENIIRRYYNADGTRKSVPDAAPQYLSEINLPSMEMYIKLEAYFLDFVDYIREVSKGEPAVFVESIVYGAKEDEAGTIDVLIVEQDGTTSVLDWKFLQVYGDNDIPWFKQGAYNEQLTAYAEKLRNDYGVKKFRYIRAIPILMEFGMQELTNGDMEKVLTGIAIGTVNPAEIEDIRLVPVSAREESTGYKAADEILRSLNSLLDNISQEDWIDEEEREYKIERMNNIRKAMRYLQGNLDFRPLIETIFILRQQGDMLLEKFRQYETLPARNNDIDNKQLSDFSYDVRNYLAVTRLFQFIDEDLVPLLYTPEAEAQAVTEAEKAQIEVNKALAIKLEAASKSVRKSSRIIEEESRKFADKHIGQRNLVAGLQSPEAVIKGLGAYFEGAAEIDSAAIKILTRLIEEAQVKAQRAAVERVNKLMELREKIKSKHGNIKNYISKIFQYSEKGEFVNKLIRQYKLEFYTEVDKRALTPKADNMEWLRENINLDEVRREAAPLIEKKLTAIEENILYAEEETDTEEDTNRKLYRKEQAKKAVLRTYDVDDSDFIGWNNYIIKRHPLDKWYTDEYKAIKEEGAEAFELYNFIRELNAEAKDSGYINAMVEKVFLPFVRKRASESFKLDGILSQVGNWFSKLQARADDVGFGQMNEVTKELEMSIPKYYTRDFTQTEELGVNDYSDVSEEVFANLVLYIQHMERYKYLDEVEDQILLVEDVERFKNVYETTVLGDVARENGSVKERKTRENNAKIFTEFKRALLYGQKYAGNDADTPIPLKEVGDFIKTAGNAILGRDYFKIKQEETPTYTSTVKTIDSLNMLTQLKFLGLEAVSGAVNLFGMNLQLIAQSGKYFDARDIEANSLKLWKHLFGRDKDDKVFFQLLETFMPLSEDPNYKKFLEAGLTPQTRRSFSDDIMVFMRMPEQLMEKSVFKTILDTFMVENGRVVSIREFVKNKYKGVRYSSGENFSKYKKIIAEEEEELKRTRSLSKLAKLEDGKLVIPGLDLNNIEEIKRVALLSRRISNRASGKTSEVNRSRASMNVWLSTLLVFKRWIPPLMSTRFSQLKLVNDDISVTITEEGDIEGANYDIGRIRLYLYVISKSLKERVFNVRRILKGTDEGIKKLEELYMEYAADYEKRTGKVFAMDREAFYDMVRSNLRKQEQEMAIFAALFVMLFTSGVIGPDDDEGRAAKNRHRYFQKVLKKFYDEIGFFYNPFNITSQLSAGVPAISILDDFAKFIDHVVMEVTGLDVSDPTKSYEEVKKKAKPVKYFFKMFPGTRSFLNYMAIASDDFAKEYDITIQKEPRR